jgi:hypothetical protein
MPKRKHKRTRKRRLMPETVDLPGEHHAEIRTDLTGGDQRWFYSERGKLARANGTAKPARTEPDPANPAQMKNYPAEPAYLTEDDNFAMLDALIARLMTSCTIPGIMPWKPLVKDAAGNVTELGTRDTADLDLVDAIDAAIGTQMRRLQGIPDPKRARSGGTGGSSSPDDASAPPTEPTPET